MRPRPPMESGGAVTVRRTTIEDRRILVVSNRLPITLERRDGRLLAQRTVGGLASALSSVAEHTQLLWIGWPGFSPDDQGQRAEIRAQLAGFGSHPVFIPPGQFDRYYQGFSNNCLWPLFHYFPRLAKHDPADWEAYRRVNQLFCRQLLEVARPGDAIWVHDYHLMLLPALLRRELPEAAVGFFLHIPFPSYEVFREVPWREDLLRGLLGADLVGFHTFDYMRHFLSSLLRGLGLEHDFGQVVVADRVVRADTFPLGVDTRRLAELVSQPAAQEQIADLQRKLGGQRLILSVDRLDFTKGLAQRLLAFDQFLDRYREWRGRVSLILISVPSRTKLASYQELKRQVDELVGRINGRFGTPGWTPISYLYRSFATSELVAFYRAADVALVTPLRDGMNLVAKEYLACRLDDSGVLVLSETAGAAAELGEALLVNPNDLAGMADALQAALTMPVSEQAGRNRPMRERLRRYDVRRWADDYLSQLADIKALQGQRRQRRLDEESRAALLAHYRASTRRLLLLDYDGTLVPLARLPELAVPDAPLQALLARLAAAPSTTAVVISGRDHATLERWLGATGVTLVAEHGAWLLPGRDSRWQIVDGEGDTDWKEQIRPWLERFVDRTPGSFVEDKSLALAWHYRLADPELGSLRAKELADTLASFVANTSLHVLTGSKVLEVKQSSVGKGKTAARWLQQAGAPPDFVLAIGDDETDERMFEALPEGAWSIRVGHTLHSRAGFYVNHPGDVRELLGDLVDAPERPGRPAGPTPTAR